MNMKYTYLALGDSYTIGEQVPIAGSFPYQAVQLLRRSGYAFYAPEIIAKTGETTDELLAQIERTVFLPSYDIVSLLIGVNNQYRGRSVDNFGEEFTMLLLKCIRFAGGDKTRVIVLSIPDWGVTPFAKGKDRAKIAKEIDAYNAVCAKISAEMQCRFIDITAAQRADAADTGFVAADGLHPSAKEYEKWAVKFVEAVKF